jgi:hypothetical protein
MRKYGEKTNLSQRLIDDHDHHVAIVIFHSFLAQDLHDRFGKMVKGASEAPIVRKENGRMPDVEDTRPNGTQERDYKLNKRVFVEELCRRVRVN